MEDLIHRHSLTVRISSPDDARNLYEQTFIVKSSYSLGGPVLLLEVSKQRAGYAQKGEPVINSLASQLSSKLGWGRRKNSRYSRYSNNIRAPDNFDVMFEMGSEPKGLILASRKTPHYELMGLRTKKKNMTTALARTMYRSCFEDDGHVLGAYVMKMITLPENVAYALENRAPYDFYPMVASDDIPTSGNPVLRKVDSRLNVKMIGDKECALEISDGVWGPIPVKELDSFMDCYHHGQSRSKKWYMISPKKLWSMLLGTEPTKAQLKIMYGFLSQNRTDDIVEERAKTLMLGMETRFPERIKIIKDEFEDDDGIKQKSTRMYIKGNIADWMIIDKAWKSNVQKVKTFVYRNNDEKPAGRYTRNQKFEKYQSGWWSGPICIDNIHNNSSVGDQFVARAMALLNDKETIELVSTIKSYLDSKMIDGTRIERLNWDAIGKEEESFWTELDYLNMLERVVVDEL